MKLGTRQPWVDQLLIAPVKEEPSSSWWAEPRDRQQFTETAKAQIDRLKKSKFGRASAVLLDKGIE